MKAARNTRRSGRVILLNPLRQVLLIRFVIERAGQPFVFWATPGGGVEKGETDLAAARRELLEELCLDIPLTGPVQSVTSTFEFEGKPLTCTDVFFVGRHESLDVALHFETEAERVAMRELRWWTIPELEQTSETVFPEHLTKVLRRLVGQEA